MGSVHDVIEAFRQAPSNSERGTKFEKLMVRYFELDPMLSQQYDAGGGGSNGPTARARSTPGLT
jgi:predicted helicase